MRRFLKWLRCAWAGHPRNLTILERFGEPPCLWATEERCDCGKSRAPMYPGAVHKAWHEAYASYPTKWPELFSE